METTTTAVTTVWVCDQDKTTTATTTGTDPTNLVIPTGWAQIAITTPGVQPVYALLCATCFAPYLAALQAFLAANPTGL